MPQWKYPIIKQYLLTNIKDDIIASILLEKEREQKRIERELKHSWNINTFSVICSVSVILTIYKIYIANEKNPAEQNSRIAILFQTIETFTDTTILEFYFEVSDLKFYFFSQIAILEFY